VVVTGHTGFKGTWLTMWLKKLGAQVIGISLSVPSEPSHFEAANIADQITDYRIDIRDGAALKELLKREQPDFVFHLAAQPLVRLSYVETVETWTTNTIGTVNVLEALREVENHCVAILITSDKCYDNVEWVWGYRETDALGGPDPYSASKGAAELAIRSYVRSFFPQEGNIHIGVGRAGNVIGGGDWAQDRIVPDCMLAWSRNELVALRNPASTRPWQHVLEPLSGYLSLAIAIKNDPKLHGEPFNFGPAAQKNYSVGDLVVEMSKHWDQVRWKDVSQNRAEAYESALLKLNCDKALHTLRWEALWDFETTVSQTVNWYRTYYSEPKSTMADYTMGQIETYEMMAKDQNLLWAR